MEKYWRAYNKGFHKESNQFSRNNIAGRYSYTFAKKIYAPTFMFRTKCFKFHNVGHISQDCKMKWVTKQIKGEELPRKTNKVWRRKQVAPEEVYFENALNAQDNNTCC